MIKRMATTLMAIAALCASHSDVLSAEARPNILFCMSDDQSYAHTSANGDSLVKTLCICDGLEVVRSESSSLGYLSYHLVG